MSSHFKMLTKFESKIYSYGDRHKVFMKNMMDRIEWMKNLSPQLFHKVLYMFKEFVVEQDEVVLR